MHVRLTTVTGVITLIPGSPIRREKMVPQLTQIRGGRGLTASVDRSTGPAAVLGRWENEAALTSRDTAVSKARTEGAVG
jgi:hypothetical protein